MSKPPNVNDAYALTDSDGLRALYENWAPVYDTGFGAAMGYRLPAEVAQAFVTAGGTGPVLDIGAGTGLVAERLVALGVGPLDALDLSPAMLAVARDKGLYRDLYAVDLTQPGAGRPRDRYAGIVSAGTFTLGHLGPEALAPVLSLLAPGGCAVLSVNLAHYEAAGFDAALSALRGGLARCQTRDVRIYDDRADSDHADDLARLLILHSPPA